MSPFHAIEHRAGELHSVTLESLSPGSPSSCFVLSGSRATLHFARERQSVTHDRLRPKVPRHVHAMPLFPRGSVSMRACSLGATSFTASQARKSLIMFKCHQPHDFVYMRESLTVRAISHFAESRAVSCLNASVPEVPRHLLSGSRASLQLAGETLGATFERLKGFSHWYCWHQNG